MPIHLVGAGPGPIDLLTVRATRMLSSADVVIYSAEQVDPALISYCREDVIVVDADQLVTDQLLQVLVTAEQMGHTVVHLMAGDGTSPVTAELLAHLRAAGLQPELTPGVAPPTL